MFNSQQRSIRLKFIGLMMLAFVFSNAILADDGPLILNGTSAFPGKPGKKKKFGSKQKDVSLFNIDVFAGPALNNATGDFLKFQEGYYETGQPYLVAAGEFKNYFGATGGLAIRIAPWWNNSGVMSELSFWTGMQYFRRGLVHQFSMENFRVKPASDFTRWRESYSSNHISIPLMARFGSKFHIETGIAPELFLGGIMEQEIKRQSFGNSAFAGGFDEQETISYKLSGKTMKTLTMGFNLGLGYNFVQEFGMKLFVNYNTGYFKEQPSLKQTQASLLLVYTWHQ